MVPKKRGNNDYDKFVTEFANSSPNIKSKTVNPLLEEAIQNNAVKIAGFLIDNGADVNLKNTDNISPLVSSILHDNFNIYELLISRGATIETDAILYLQASEEGLKICKDLVKHHVNINAIYEKGCIIVILLKQVIYDPNRELKAREILRILTQNGLDWNNKNEQLEATPLQLIIREYLKEENPSVPVFSSIV